MLGVAGAVVVWLVLRSLVTDGPVGPGGWLLALAVGAGLAAAVRRSVVVGARAAALADEVDRLRGAASLDALTGLAGPDAVATEIDRRLAGARPGELVAVVVCGLDRLSAVSDAFGHRAADEVVAVAARRLAGAIRDGDALGRLGGGDFVIVSSGLPAYRDLDLLADRLLEPLRQPTALDRGRAPVVTGSVGVAAVVGGSGGDLDVDPGSAELVRRAHAAAHRARADGGDRAVVADEAVWAEPIERLELEQALRAALRDDQLVVHYQPIVDARTGLVDRVEALVRWDHPERRTVLPSEFLPVAARSNLIVDIGGRVLTEACRQAQVWSQRLGRPISVSVNVAERQLLDVGLVDTVTRALADAGLPADQLELEVSEDVVMDRLDRALVVLRQLDLIGVRLAIDDFGTSRASLGRLKQLAMVSTLKMDRRFVADMTGAEDQGADRAIVAAIVALADGVGMSVVAEGVETPEQAAILRDLGVDHLQGFLFHRPGPAPAIERVFESPTGWTAGPRGS